MVKCAQTLVRHGALGYASQSALTTSQSVHDCDKKTFISLWNCDTNQAALVRLPIMKLAMWNQVQCRGWLPLHCRR